MQDLMTLYRKREVFEGLIFHVAMLLPLIGDSQEEVFYQNNRYH